MFEFGMVSWLAEKHGQGKNTEEGGLVLSAVYNGCGVTNATCAMLTFAVHTRSLKPPGGMAFEAAL